MGVILYILICGSPPFYGANDAAIRESVLKQKFAFDCNCINDNSLVKVWDSISSECKDLIKKMLRSADKRLAAKQVLDHSWLKILDSKPSSLLPIVDLQQLGKFRTYQKVKQAVLTYLATRMCEAEVAPLKALFLTLDKNGDGILSTEEITSGITKTVPKPDLFEIVKSMDTNASGFIDYNGTYLMQNIEFLTAGIKEDIYLKVEKLLEAFTAFDTVIKDTIALGYGWQNRCSRAEESTRA